MTDTKLEKITECSCPSKSSSRKLPNISTTIQKLLGTSTGGSPKHQPVINKKLPGGKRKSSILLSSSPQKDATARLPETLLRIPIIHGMKPIKVRIVQHTFFKGQILVGELYINVLQDVGLGMISRSLLLRENEKSIYQNVFAKPVLTYRIDHALDHPAGEYAYLQLIQVDTLVKCMITTPTIQAVIISPEYMGLSIEQNNLHGSLSLESTDFTLNESSSCDLIDDASQPHSVLNEFLVIDHALSNDDDFITTAADFSSEDEEAKVTEEELALDCERTLPWKHHIPGSFSSDFTDVPSDNDLRNGSIDTITSHSPHSPLSPPLATSSKSTKSIGKKLSYVNFVEEQNLASRSLSPKGSIYFTHEENSSIFFFDTASSFSNLNASH